MTEECYFQDIPYTLVRKQVKNLNLRVRADGTVAVSAPFEISQEKIVRFLKKRERYIREHLSTFNDQTSRVKSPKKYVNGVGIRLLGKDIRVKVVKIPRNEEETCYCDGVYLYVKVYEEDSFENKSRLVKCFLNDVREHEFSKITDETLEKLEKYGISRPKIKISEMKSRWGSCSAKESVIHLNSLLIEMPRPCIEYVILHEMCHFLHQNHSDEFYEFLSMFMVDWKENKRILELMGK